MTISENCEIVGFRFSGDIKYDNLSELLPHLINLAQNKKILFIGCGNDETDKVLLVDITKNLSLEGCIIANINEKTYKTIIPWVIKGKHYAILKTPIDINLAKELNILVTDMGLPFDKILMNTDIGGLGYGYEYGYSIMEKVLIEGKTDKYLNFPLFCDASYESMKTKEAKSDDFPPSWGNLSDRKKMIELSSCAGVLAAGANIIAVSNPNNIDILKGMV